MVMDTFECISTKFDVREFSPKEVPAGLKMKVLEAARMTGTGLNTQHWRFILVEKKDNLATLAADSTSGMWVAGANFAVIVLTNPKHRFHAIDAGRVIQNMQLAAWNFGIASGVFTGVNEVKLRADFGIQAELQPTIVVGFGYPHVAEGQRDLAHRKKNRMPLPEIAFSERYGNKLELGPAM